MKLLLTAGFNRALHVVTLGELLRRGGHDVAGILVVSPFSLRRARALVRQRGRTFLRDAVLRLTGQAYADGSTPLKEFMKRRDISDRSLRSWARANGATYKKVSSLNAPAAVELVAAAGADGVLYGGGGILRRAFLDASGGRVLNAHSGPLPEIRGMNALEWSLMLGLDPVVTIHFIDRGIDTGVPVDVLPVPVEAGDDLATLRSKCAVLGVEGLLNNLDALLEKPPRSERARAVASRQCFVMAPALKEILERRLATDSVSAP